MINCNLKMELENLKGRWADNLPELLWAYKTTARLTTGGTPFSLAYGYEAIVLVKLGAGSLRRDNFDLEQNMILQRCELDFLKEKWCVSMTHYPILQFEGEDKEISRRRPRL